jgi:hypothetical protein
MKLPLKAVALIAATNAVAPANARDMNAAQETLPDHPALSDRFFLGAGAFFPKTTTSAQGDSRRLGVGANVDFERALGMETGKTVPNLFLRARLGERWRIEAEYFEINRSGHRTIDRDIQWRDTVFPVNAQLSSTFDFSDLRLSGGYSIFKTRDKDVGLGFGLHAADYDVTLRDNAGEIEHESVTAPLPVVSFFWQFALTGRWALSGRADRFLLSYDIYDGSLTALGTDLMYQPFRNLGFGLGYRNLFISVEASKNSGTLKFKQTFQGPMLYVNASF